MGERIICNDNGGELREEITRCRDCRHYVDDEMEYYHYCLWWSGNVEPDGFCDKGERRKP